MKVIIIGAGWFGCHIATILEKKKIEVLLVEKEKDIFLGQSGFNSNRLHLGFHYPRANLTRKQCKYSFKKFILKYPSLVDKIKYNFIGIHKNSKVSFFDYQKIMKQSDLKFQVSKKIFNINNAKGFIKCDEMLIKSDASINYFKKKLSKIKKKYNFNVTKIKNLKNYVQINGIKDKFDWAIDCSGCSIKKINNFNVLYEPRITLVYKSNKKSLAIMLMDGKFWSIYPIKKDLYSLGSVIHSRLSKGFKNKLKAEQVLKKFNKADISNIIKKFENQVLSDFPKFKSLFKYYSFYTSVATINHSINDDRPFKIYKKKRIISILGGKIDTVIEAGEKGKGVLKI